MTEKSIQHAIGEAKRFLAAANVVLGESAKEYTSSENKKIRYLAKGKNTGTLRRASLDLTRALAEMRRYE